MCICIYKYINKYKYMYVYIYILRAWHRRPRDGAPNPKPLTPAGATCECGHAPP